MLGCQIYCKLFPLSPAAGVGYSSLYDIGHDKVSSSQERLVHCYWSSRMRRPIAKMRKLIIFRSGGFCDRDETMPCLSRARMWACLPTLGCLSVATGCYRCYPKYRNCIEFQNHPSLSSTKVLEWLRQRASKEPDPIFCIVFAYYVLL